MLAPLRRRSIRFLWIGQVLSAIGDQFYLVAVLWYALDQLGNDAGFLSAAQAASVCAIALFGNAWADRWDPRRTMLVVDLIRGALVLALPVAAMLGVLSLSVLVPIALIVAGLTGFFDPALQASVPRLASDLRLRHATNALFDSTARLARIIGPGLIGVANSVLPILHFFTVNAISFFASALAIRALAGELPRQLPPDTTQQSAWQSLTAGFRALKRHPLVLYAFTTGILVNFTWSLGFTMGMALLLRATMPNSLAAYGWMISAYGVGNVVSNLVVANRAPTAPHWPIVASRVLFGFGVTAMAFAPNLASLLVIAALTAINGPLGDLTMMNLLQTRFPPMEIARMVRVRFFFSYLGILGGYLAAPVLYDLLPPRVVISGAGLATAFGGLVGAFVLFRRQRVLRPAFGD